MKIEPLYPSNKDEYELYLDCAIKINEIISYLNETASKGECKEHPHPNNTTSTTCRACIKEMDQHIKEV